MRKLPYILMPAVLAACALFETRTVQTIYTPIRNDGSVAAEEIGNRIFKAAKRIDWNPRRDGEGRIIAEHAEDKREARVLISYTDEYYIIDYNESYGMNFDEKFRTINRAYNDWVGFLNHAIAADMTD
jgi:hypothetical protein